MSLNSRVKKGINGYFDEKRVKKFGVLYNMYILNKNIKISFKLKF